MKTIKKISVIMVLALLFFSHAFASEVNSSIDSIDKDNSIYKYNALENKISFSSLINVENLPEKYLKSDKLSDDFIKQLQNITEKQNFSINKTENAINTIQNRNKLKTFLIGNNLGILRFQLVQIKDQTYLLGILTLETENNMNKIQIDNHIKLLKEEQIKVEEFILEQENKFSLFGWFVTIL